MKQITVKGRKVDYKQWEIFFGGWKMVDPADTYQYSKRRLPIPEEMAEKRKQHMKELHAEGAPYAWIARLYEMDRAQVYRIINDKPNN